ncbi:hypothetical protein EV144_106260 [Flavobacterium sp. 270]|uniref:hypothetical protein n=1 Tax=Flavobacterium sp. 270 TaxID=2512114 RepID=UPI001065DA67|nr:hypothetical protein [Flavobacterium sp. 270]TDW46588.1 hypothetical protein EV144_106260 [Flavobacterium sp. 270]
MLRNFISLVFISIILISCAEKKEKEFNELSNDSDTIKKNLVDSLKSSDKKNEDFKIGKIYNDSDLNLASININYNNGKYKFEREYPDFLIDSTITEEEKKQSILVLGNENVTDKNVIRIEDFGVLNINDQGNLLTVFFEKEKGDKWKAIDKLNIGKAINTDLHQYEMEGNKYLSFSCYNNKHNEYFGVVINKVDPSGKYEKVVRAFKFDLVNGKIIEIDLKKEKVECFSEIGDE